MGLQKLRKIKGRPNKRFKGLKQKVIGQPEQERFLSQGGGLPKTNHSQPTDRPPDQPTDRQAPRTMIKFMNFFIEKPFL